MNARTQPADSTLKAYLTHLKRKWRTVVLPAAVLGSLALAYAIGRPDAWKASQALLVRDETGGNLGRQGRFDNVEAMKTAQETVGEVARHSHVVSAALASIGPPADRRTSEPWPTRGEVQQAQRGVTVAAPKGAEFGRTEMIYLSAVAGSRERAVALTRAVCEQLQKRLNDVRNAKAQSIIAELSKAVTVAQSDLDAATDHLERVEREVGSDLGELRLLTETGTGESNVRSALTQIKTELRQTRTLREANQQRLSLLREIQGDPRLLVDAPSQLFDSQPGLRRLKEGLVDARLRTAQLLGRMNDDHPEVRAAQSAEQQVRSRLQSEIGAVIRSLVADLQVSDAQIAALERQLADVEGRFGRVASVRAKYGNLVAEVRRCSETLAKAQKELSDARANRAAAQSASLLTRIDEPEAGDRPLPPGRATLVAGGTLGGLSIGLAWVFLTVPVGGQGGRRWSDYFRGGRRSDDRPGQPRDVERRSCGATVAFEPTLTVISTCDR
jgi:uncharacterized protein involved in exopolysaccharide biosynthesis